MTNQKLPREKLWVKWLGISETTIAHISDEQKWATDRCIVLKKDYDSLASQLEAANAERDFCKAQWEMTEKRFTTRCDNLVEQLAAANAEVERLRALHLERTKSSERWLNERDQALAEVERLKAKLENTVGLANRGLEDRAIEIAQLREWCAKLEAALENILHLGNTAALGKWNATGEMKQEAYDALTAYRAWRGGVTKV